MLHPFDREEFLTERFERRPLLVRREQPDYFRHLLSWEVIDRVVTELNRHHPDVMLADQKVPRPVSSYTYPSGLIDVTRLYQAFADGASIVLGNLEVLHPPISDACRALEAELSTRFQANIYVTPPGHHQGLPSHWDTHDVFVLQVEGTKEWCVWEEGVELPLRTESFNPADLPELGEPAMRFMLEPGDTFYLPRGFVHKAITGESGSAHITLGVMFASWAELLLEAVATATKQHTDARRSLPLGFTRPEYDRNEAKEYFENLMKKVWDDVDFDGAFEHFAEDLVASRHSILRGQRAQVMALGELSIDTECEPRANVLYRITEDEERVSIACYGNNIHLPSFCAEPLRFAVETDSYHVRDLPGDLDDDGKLVLITRLVREGLITMKLDEA
ncbi:MAG: ribosomal protein L16 Arg81 hydroxylase [Polyangiales bacterium]|jgi:ribosomal protein L16 Arg81 hydroxylase